MLVHLIIKSTKIIHVRFIFYSPISKVMYRTDGTEIRTEGYYTEYLVIIIISTYYNYYDLIINNYDLQIRKFRKTKHQKLTKSVFELSETTMSLNEITFKFHNNQLDVY